MAILALRGVTKAYAKDGGAVTVLREATLALEPGAFVALRGPSGAGKSTLLWIAGTLLAPDAGEVELAGQRPYALAQEARARLRAKEVGFVFQQFHLVPYLDVRENVLAATVATGGDRDAAERRAAELIERFGLTGRTHHLPSELSTGERQRTALARALLNEPRLLLADEPTGNLDTVQADAVLTCLSDFAKQGGAVLMVTHSQESAARAERTWSLSDGRIVEAVSAPAQG